MCSSEAPTTPNPLTETTSTKTPEPRRQGTLASIWSVRYTGLESPSSHESGLGHSHRKLWWSCVYCREMSILLIGPFLTRGVPRHTRSTSLPTSTFRSSSFSGSGLLCVRVRTRKLEPTCEKSTYKSRSKMERVEKFLG